MMRSSTKPDISAGVGSWHVRVKLPDGRHAVADWRDPIVLPMRQINYAIGTHGQPPPSAYAAVAQWLSEHAGQSEDCLNGKCGHD